MAATFWVLLCLKKVVIYMNEFSRTESLIGTDNLNKIKSSKVLVIGLGGVGGSAVETLVRSGVENIILVDYDKVDITNINRQVIALHSTIGEYKTDVFESRIKDINPNCNVIKINKKIDSSNIDELFSYDIDYIIDACDTVETKKLLITKSHDKNINLISSMGTAKKLDPTKLVVTDIRKTSYDKLAKVLRKWVIDEKINYKVMVVSSTEEVIKTDDNLLASMSFVPNTAGILCAKYVIDKILIND